MDVSVYMKYSDQYNVHWNKNATPISSFLRRKAKSDFVTIRASNVSVIEKGDGNYHLELFENTDGSSIKLDIRTDGSTLAVMDLLQRAITTNNYMKSNSSHNTYVSIYARKDNDDLVYSDVSSSEKGLHFHIKSNGFNDYYMSKYNNNTSLNIFYQSPIRYYDKDSGKERYITTNIVLSKLFIEANELEGLVKSSVNNKTGIASYKSSRDKEAQAVLV